MISETEKLFVEVRDILAKILKMDAKEILPESRLQDDLGIDSVDFWDIVASFDKKYKIRLSEKEVEDLITVSDLVNAFTRKLGKR